MKISFDNLGQIGIVKDIPDYELPYNAWSAGNNVRFDNNKVVKFKGHKEVYATPSIAPYHLYPVLTASTYYWVYAGLNKVYVTEGTAHYNITRQSGGTDVNYSADADIGWNGGVLNGIPVFNNGVDDPQAWSPVGTGTRLTSLDWVNGVSTWSSLGYSAKAIRPFKNFLVALDFDNGSTRYPRQVRWSDAATAGNLPSTWDHTDETALAGFTTELEETPGFALDCLPQRDVNIIYKEDSTWGMQLTGGNDVFRFYKLFSETGLLSRRCVKDFEGKHVAFTVGPDLVIHDGQNVTSLLDTKWQRWLSTAVDPTNYQRSYIAPNYAMNEMWACFPSVDSTFPDKAIVWNWKDNSIGVRDLPLAAHIAFGVVNPETPLTWDTWTGTWDTLTGVWDERYYNPTSQNLLMADPTNTKMYLADYTDQFDGTNMTSYVERTGLAVAGQKRDGTPTIDLDSIKQCKAIYPKFEAPNGTAINVYVGSQMEIGDSVSWSAAQVFTVGTDYKIDIRKSGRLLAVKFETTADVEWKLTSYAMDIDIVGRR